MPRAEGLHGQIGQVSENLERRTTAGCLMTMLVAVAAMLQPVLEGASKNAARPAVQEF